ASSRVPSMRLTVLFCRSSTPNPLPLSVYATAHPCLSPHSPAVAMAPYTPREPEDAAVTMHGLVGSNEFGTCTIMVTLTRPVASRPPVSRSSLPPSYTVLTTDPRATNDGNALLSELEQAAVTARNESTIRFDTAPPRQFCGAP